jgi:hypothetical protein
MTITNEQLELGFDYWLSDIGVESDAVNDTCVVVDVFHIVSESTNLSFRYTDFNATLGCFPVQAYAFFHTGIDLLASVEELKGFSCNLNLFFH